MNSSSSSSPFDSSSSSWSPGSCLDSTSGFVSLAPEAFPTGSSFSLSWVLLWANWDSKAFIRSKVCWRSCSVWDGSGSRGFLALASNWAILAKSSSFCFFWACNNLRVSWAEVDFFFISLVDGVILYIYIEYIFSRISMHDYFYFSMFQSIMNPSSSFWFCWWSVGIRMGALSGGAISLGN